MAMTDKHVWTQEYLDGIFSIWYSSGKIPLSDLVEKLPKDDRGESPTLRQLAMIRTTEAWQTRADIIDAEAEASLTQHLVQVRADMLKRQADLGLELQNIGSEYLRNNGIDTVANALKAISIGMEMERDARGMNVAISAIPQMRDDQVKKEIQMLMDKALGRNYIDAKSKNVDSDWGEESTDGNRNNQ